MSIPQSARAHIIGKQGSTIKAIQEKSGARIQLPKVEDAAADDEDGVIDVIVEGNALSAATAREAINKIVGERSANVTTKLKSIPAEFYPFIAGPSNSLANSLETEHGVQIRVPPHQPWSHPIPKTPEGGQRPIFAPSVNDNHIQLAGDRLAIQAARAAIEHRVQELQNQLQIEQADINKGRHQFIIGDRGIPMEQFFADTNCVIILPNEEGVDTVTVIGQPDDVNRGLDRAIDLAMAPQVASFNASRFHRHAAGGAPVYSRDMSRYLRRRKEIERLEQLYNVHINTPFAEGIDSPWELYARDGKNSVKAQKEMTSIINSHPPSRFASLPVDPFFHSYLRSDITPKVRQEYGVYTIVPDAAEGDLPVLLVYEGPSSLEGYHVPQSVPAPPELQSFQKGLVDARKHILDLLSRQEQLASNSLEVPIK